MGELVFLDEYREARLRAEVESLQKKLREIIDYYDLHVENLPYFDYDSNKVSDFTYVMSVTVIDPYY